MKKATLDLEMSKIADQYFLSSVRRIPHPTSQDSFLYILGWLPPLFYLFYICQVADISLLLPFPSFLLSSSSSHIKIPFLACFENLEESAMSNNLPYSTNNSQWNFIIQINANICVCSLEFLMKLCNPPECSEILRSHWQVLGLCAVRPISFSPSLHLS